MWFWFMVKLVMLIIFCILLLFFGLFLFIFRVISEFRVFLCLCSVLLYRCMVLSWCGVGVVC